MAAEGSPLSSEGSSYTYDGYAKKPNVTVIYDRTKLKEDDSYTVEYLNNVNAGAASVVVKGTGDYDGTVTKTFTIGKAEQTINVPKTAYRKELSKKSFRLKATALGKLSYSSTKTGVASVAASGRVTMKSYGVTTIKIKAAATENYQAASKNVKVYVQLDKPKAKGSSPKKYRAKISWKRDSKASGYQVQYSTSSYFSYKSSKTLGKKSSYIAKKLTSRGTYYLRVRSYKKTRTGKVYSGWSNVVRVTVK